jgi:hypothetical protein
VTEKPGAELAAEETGAELPSVMTGEEPERKLLQALTAAEPTSSCYRQTE